MDALPYRLISDADKTTFIDNLLPTLSTWAGMWFYASPQINLHVDTVQAPAFSSHEKWLILGEEPDAWVAWKLDGVINREMLGMMFDASLGWSTKTTVLMQELLNECMAGFANAIFSAISLPPSTDTPRISSLETLRIGHGSGVLIAELGSAFPKQSLLFGGDVVERAIKLTHRPLPSLSQLVSRASSVGNYVTRLEVTAGKAELTLQDIALLEVGDVIPLDTTVQAPFFVRTAEGVSIATAHLGLYGTHKAIKFIDDNKHA